MERSISNRNTANSSTAKPLGKNPPGDKSLGIDTAIYFYEIEEYSNTEEGEEEEILIIHDKSLPRTKQNLVKRNFAYIDTFNNTGTDVVCAMHKLTVVVFEQL